jgi:hypothetical protein
MEANNIDIEKLLKNKLKQQPIEKIEDAIAKAVSDLIGEDYNCDISSIKYTLFSGAEITLKIELSAKSGEKKQNK